MLLYHITKQKTKIPKFKYKKKNSTAFAVLFSNRQLSILPGRFQPSTFDV